MLVLSRFVNESILVGDSIRITLVRCGDGRARIGIEAPKDVAILRNELQPRDKQLTDTMAVG